MSRLASSYNESRPADNPASRPGFVPWDGEALGDRDTTPYAITERLPPTAPARGRPASPPAPRPVAAASRWRVPVGVLVGGVIVVAVIILGLALAQRSSGGKRLLAAVNGGGAARIPLPRNGTGGLEPSAAAAAAAAADYLPTGVPVKRTDWVITKDYAAHGGDDPVARQKWGAVDFAFWQNKNALGAELLATHAGKIKLLPDDPTYGNLVYVMGPHYTTTYGHMERFNVTAGQDVRRGDVIGFMGSTGDSTGPHVDYQVWKDGQNQNPLDYCQCGMKGAGAP